MESPFHSVLSHFSAVRLLFPGLCRSAVLATCYGIDCKRAQFWDGHAGLPSDISWRHINLHYLDDGLLYTHSETRTLVVHSHLSLSRITLSLCRFA